MTSAQFKREYIVSNLVITFAVLWLCWIIGSLMVEIVSSSYEVGQSMPMSLDAFMESFKVGAWGTYLADKMVDIVLAILVSIAGIVWNIVVLIRRASAIKENRLIWCVFLIWFLPLFLPLLGFLISMGAQIWAWKLGADVEPPKTKN